MSELKTQIGILSTADLEDGTLTFEVDIKTMVARAGKYAIVPFEEYERLARRKERKSFDWISRIYQIEKRKVALLLMSNLNNGILTT